MDIVLSPNSIRPKVKVAIKETENAKA